MLDDEIRNGNLSYFDLILELVKAIIQPSEFVDVLLILPCHFRIGSSALTGRE